MTRRVRATSRSGRALRASASIVIGVLALGALSGCVAAPLFDGFLLDAHERVPPHATTGPEPTDVPPPPEEPDAVATAVPTESPAAPDGDGARELAVASSRTAAEPGV